MKGRVDLIKPGHFENQRCCFESTSKTKESSTCAEYVFVIRTKRSYHNALQVVLRSLLCALFGIFFL
jgi:hypothetical protein